MKNAVCFDLFRICLLIHICCSQAAHSQFRQASNTTAVSTVGPRKVHVITSLDFDKRAISLKTGRWLLGGHGTIWIDGTATDGPLLVEIGFSPLDSKRGRGLWAIRTKDLGVYNTGKPIRTQPAAREVRHVASTGSTLLTNAELFNHATGTGLVADAWNEDPVYVIGTGSRPNTCYDFVIRVLARMDLKLDSLTEELFDNSEEYYSSYSQVLVQRIKDVASVTSRPVNEHFDELHTRVFDVDFVQNPSAPVLIWESFTVVPVMPDVETNSSSTA